MYSEPINVSRRRRQPLGAANCQCYALTWLYFLVDHPSKRAQCPHFTPKPHHDRHELRWLVCNFPKVYLFGRQVLSLHRRRICTSRGCSCTRRLRAGPSVIAPPTSLILTEPFGLSNTGLAPAAAFVLLNRIWYEEPAGLS
jgi:hypothetical protein